MLTADLVNARRVGRELRLTPLDAAARARAIELATLLIGIASSQVGGSREEFEESCAAVVVAPRERRLADGLTKLVEDRCEFDADAAIDPAELRRSLFLRASEARQGGSFDRQAVVASVAAERGLGEAELDQALYADLRGAQTLKSMQGIAAADLVDAYELAQAQAVLLRAVRLTIDVDCRTPGAYRALFHKLKFLRLLYLIQPLPAGGYRIEIDGPFSLFDSVTKYGLKLALVLPAVRACAAFRLEAEVRWGKDRTPLTFRLEGKNLASSPDDEPPRLADEVSRLLADLAALKSPWKISPATEILNLPGLGLCIPDLVFQKPRSAIRVYVEVLGFWSRAAVWRRVELVEQGLSQRILFAVSQHLRVSEEVLGDELPGALYVYKRILSARTVLERVQALAERAAATRFTPAT